MNPKILLIDLDGTLLASDTRKLAWLFSISFVKSLMKEGIPFFKALRILHLQKKWMMDSSHQSSKEKNQTKFTRRFIELSGISADKAPEFLRSMTVRCFQDAGSALSAIPEAQKFIAWAKDHYRLVLATNPMWPAEAVMYRLGLTGISAKQFEFITTAENMSANKPHVEYYQELIAMLQLDPQSCLMIGNDAIKDGNAAKVGIPVFILKSPQDFIQLQNQLMQKQGN